MNIDRILKFIRIPSFAITVLTTIPLFISYVRDVDPQYAVFTHLHVWFGLIFIVVAVVSMLLEKYR